MNAQQYLLREYLKLLWGDDSAFQVDWRAVRAGEMDFHDLARKWRLPRLLRRILLDASREPEELSLQRLQEKIPALELSGFALISPSGVKMEPELPEPPLANLPIAEPSVETREQYLSRVRLLLQQEQAYPRLLHEVQTLPSEKREVYLRVLQEQQPKLLLEAQEKYPEAGQEQELQVLLLATRYYEACLQAIRPRLTPKRHLNRRMSQKYLQRTAQVLYQRVVQGTPYAEVQANLFKQTGEWVEEETLRKECAGWLKILEFPES